MHFDLFFSFADFFPQLIVNGIFTEKEGLPLLNNLLSSIMKADKENHNNISIIISFTKHCGEDFAGIIARKNKYVYVAMHNPANDF